MLFLLAACGSTLDDESGESILLQGSVQKGPLVLGSSVNVALLSGQGVPTGDVFGTTTINDLGEFWVAVPQSGPVMLEGSGFYYHEISGELSTSWITLRAIYKASKNETQAISVNPITHLSYERARTLRRQGQTWPNAIAAAEQELQVALGIGLDDLDIGEPGTSLSILGGDTLDNAYLFAVSTVLAQAGVDRAGGLDGPIDAHLQEIMNEIVFDLADDGLIDPSLRATIDAAEPGFDTTAVEAALAARLASIGSDAQVPDLDAVLDQDDDLLLNSIDNCDVVANADQIDVDMDGVGDVCDNCTEAANGDQADTDQDGVGDLCDITCGDGELDAGEACDDGNLIDGDGCNVDCSVSGQLLWEIELEDEAPFFHEENTLSMSVAADGSVALMSLAFDLGLWLSYGSVQRFDADGQFLIEHLVEGEEFQSGIAEPNGFILLTGGQGLSRLDEQGQAVWSFAIPGLRGPLVRNGDGPIIASTVTALTAIDDTGMGTELWSIENGQLWSYYYGLSSSADDTVVGAKRTNSQGTASVIDRYDMGGSLLTQFSIDGYATALEVLPTGEIVLTRYADPNNYLELYSADGTVMLWSVPYETQPYYTHYNPNLDIDDAGYIAYTWLEYQIDEDDTTAREYVAKVDSNGSEIWRDSLDHGHLEVPMAVEFGPEGTIYTLVTDYQHTWLRKNTP